MRMINKILLSLIAVLCLDATVTAQNKQVSGTVTDPAGAPVVGATVLVEGTTIGSTTDASGHFSLNAPEDAKLNISFIGYEPQQVDVAGRTHIPVSLKEDSHTIDDVVVTAMGMHIGELIGGTMIIENIFAWPGVGRYAVSAIFNRDYPVIQCFTLMMVTVFVLANLAVDVLNAALDPRLRRHEEVSA